MRQWFQMMVTTAALTATMLSGFGCAAYRMGAPEAPFAGTPPMTCQELKITAKKAVRDYYEAAEYDSALAALQYWTDQCGINEVTYRTTLLMYMAAGKFEDDLYDRWIIENLLAYRNKDRWHGARGRYWWMGKQDDSYDQFTRRVARKLNKELPAGSVAKLLSECYSGDCDSTFIKLQYPEYEGSKLRYYYDREIERSLEDRLEGNSSIYGGMWIPRGNSRQLGNHPVLGATVGAKRHGMLYNFAAEWRMGDSDEPYVVDHNGIVDTTTRFAGWYFGFELGRQVFRTLQHETFLRVGMGIDGFAYEPSTDDGPKQKIHSYNVNLGLGYLFYLKKHDLNYVGVEGVYNIVSYDGSGGDALAGNSISLRFLVGWGGNEVYNRRLRDLHHGY